MKRIAWIIVFCMSFLAQILGMQMGKEPLSLYQSIQDGKELTITPLDVDFCDSTSPYAATFTQDRLIKHVQLLALPQFKFDVNLIITWYRIFGSDPNVLKTALKDEKVYDAIEQNLGNGFGISTIYIRELRHDHCNQPYFEDDQAIETFITLLQEQKDKSVQALLVAALDKDNYPKDRLPEEIFLAVLGYRGERKKEQ